MESVLQEVGECGRFQVCHVSAVQACRFVTAWAASLMMFGLYNPGWHCRTSNRNDNNTTILMQAEGMNASRFTASASSAFTQIPDRTDILDPSSISSVWQDREGTTPMPVIRLTSTDFLNGSCSVAKHCDRIDFNPESSTVVTEFGLICEKVWISYVILSILNAGMLLGAFVCGQVGERFGRRIGLYGSNLVMSLACALAVFSPVWELYAVFTFFIGFGAIGVIANLSVLCMEFLTSKWRAWVTSIPIWNAGIICFALAVYILRDWKLIHLATAVICGVTCLGFFWTPESLRWLLIHGKPVEARRVVNKISRLNRKPLSEETSREIMQKDEKTDEDTDRHYTYMDLFKTRELRCLTIKLGLIWVFTTHVYELISFGIQSLPGDYYTNIVLASIVEFPGVLINGPLANRIGRRWTGVLFTSIGAFCCTVIVISLLAMDNTNIRDTVVTSLAFISRSAMQAILSFMMSYSTELMPTAVRNLGFGFFHIAVRTTGIFGPFILPRDYTSMVACFSVLMVSQVVSIALFCSLAETKNRPLRDSITAVERTRYEIES